MLRRVVVGFDGSPSAVEALDWAVREARLHGAPLLVCTVLDAPSPGAPGAGWNLTETARLTATVPHRLRALADQVTSGYPAEFVIAHGPPARALSDVVGDGDLLVVGSRGRSPVRALLLGSVSRACLHHTGRIVVVRVGPHRNASHRRVLVGVDGSPDSRVALRIAAEEAHLRGVALHAVHAVRWEHLGADWLVPDRRQLLLWGKHLVERELLLADQAARPVVVVGAPGVVLVRQSSRAELLVLGARGHNPLAVLQLGSTADHCARHARCPVMVLRPTARPVSTTHPGRQADDSPGHPTGTA